jgi:protein O-mannosyl-transferase
MITAPVLMLCYDRFFVAGTIRNAVKLRWEVYVGLFATWIIPALHLLGHYGELAASGFAVEPPVSRGVYFMTEQGVILQYLRLAFWPHPLCFDYAWPRTSFPAVMLPGLINAVILMAVLWLISRRAAVGFCGFWCLLILAPTSSCIPLGDFAAEHRMYLPLAGIVAAAVIGGYEALKRRVSPPALLGVACVLIVILGAMTYRRNEDYHSEEAMWRSVVATRPMNLRAMNDYAVTLSEAGKTDEALSEYDRVLSLIPPDLRRRLDSGEIRFTGTVYPDSLEYSYCRAHANMGLLLFTLGRNDEAIEQYAAALQVVPYLEKVRSNMRQAIRKRGVAEQAVDMEMAKELWRRGHEESPSHGK